ncbi:DUF6350 family protein [Streptomyces sp. SID10853]|uniref:cell division protein PerM n=1 Tax=Streptomyces sp. SID10853 TaxID=2706028 RepID=UPI001EF27388|nr:DUF6350 family protein [Streptomyces sp. SID10853]
MTDRSPSLAPVRSRSAALADCVLRGGLAAALGLGSLTVLVMLLWISSPYPDSGPGGALHVTAALWLLAHGTELTRHDTASGVPAPLGLVPMLLVVLPVWLVQRAARAALDPANGRPGPTVHGALCAVTGGYLLVAAAVTLYASSGPLSVVPLSALWHLPLVAGTAAGAGVWRARVFPREPFSGWGRPPYAGGRALPAGVRQVVRSPRVPTVLRAGAAGAAVLAGGGALLVAGSLVWHGGAAQESFLRLTGAVSGRFTVLLLAAALVPNAALWGASYALGPGFTLGTGSAVTPLMVTGNAALPYFPLLAALPGPGSGSPVNWAVAGVPLAAGVVVGWFVTRVGDRGRDESRDKGLDKGRDKGLDKGRDKGLDKGRGWDRGRAETAGVTALMALSAAVVCAAVMAVLAALAGGPLGTGRLTSFGPVWWQTSVATLVWTAGTALPVALFRRWWALRSSRAGAAEPAVDAAVVARVGVPAAVAATTAEAEAPAVTGPEARHGGEGSGENGGGSGGENSGDGSEDGSGRDVDAGRVGRWAALKGLSGRLLAKFPLTDAQDGFSPAEPAAPSEPSESAESSESSEPAVRSESPVPPAPTSLPPEDAGETNSAAEPGAAESGVAEPAAAAEPAVDRSGLASAEPAGGPDIWPPMPYADED